jgi:mono/diheme cytochrome c family protein
MKLITLAFGLSLALLAVGSSSALLLVNDRESDKTASLSSQNTQHLVGNAQRGEYVATMGGCIACHTDSANAGKLLAGGVPIATAFGTFYSPNITSDTSAGIGGWSEDDFLNAMSLGISPEGEHYFPAFPYTSYSAMSIQDLLDLKAWLGTVEAVTEKAPAHDVIWPVSFRPSLVVWKAMFFDPLRKTDIANRGDYLVNGPAHCAECHSPRNLLGGLSNRALTGNTRGPEGESVPGITTADLSDWVVEDLELFLEVGITPSGDFTGGHMADVIEYGTGQLTNNDRTAIANYLLSEANKP